MANDASDLIPPQAVTQSIIILRGQRVMLDAALAALYGVETKQLVRAVKRNLDRFPADFMFPLTNQEFVILRSQFGTSSSWGGRRTPPLCFTEQGVAMLSSVLRSKRAVRVNVEIMRAFVALRAVLSSHHELRQKLLELEKKYDSQFKIVFNAIKQLIEQPTRETKPIGFTK